MGNEPANRIPDGIIVTINRLVRTSQRMFRETGRQPSAEALAARLALSPEKVRGLLKIARRPIDLKPTG